MDPVPYEIRKEDVDEVLGAYESVGGSWTPDDRDAAMKHVMARVLEIDEAVRTTPEDRRVMPRGDRTQPEGSSPGDDSPRREMALAAIEDILIRDGFIDVSDTEERIFPVTERAD
ncbi:MAG: hypothetical protein ACRELT_00300 [Longimicrobiales bacterium]